MNFRICMICSQFYPVIGGTEQQAEALARELLKEGAKVFVLTQRIKGLRRRENLNGVIVYRDIIAPQWGLIFGLSYLLTTFIFLLRKRKEYDVIHCHILYLHTVSAILVKKLLKKKVVVKIAGISKFGIGDIVRIKEIKGSKIILGISRGVDRFIAISREMRNELREIGVKEEQILDIPNFVNTEKFYPISNGKRNELRNELFLPIDKKIISFVGRLYIEKGISYLIEAWSEIIIAYPEVALLIIGDGPLMKSLKDQARALNLSDKIEFLGKKENISEYLQASDIFVLPSLSEGLSGALLEAMACGLPCIATKIGGNVDLTDDGKDGILVEPASSEELASAILRLLKDKESSKNIGNQARKKILERYSINSIVPAYINLYKGLLS
ncbi:N-acetyl-alpha-D-glucosaminyl L-malate synthase [subsurface metagenome]|nr:glycosyltransferase [Clostridia bacterium]